MNCVGCGAPLKPGDPRCPHCETWNDPDLRHLGGAGISTEGGTEENCPRCEAALVRLTVTMGGAYSVGRCRRCLGTFFSPGDLKELLENVSAGRSLDEERISKLCREIPEDPWPISYLPCPSCGELMHRKGFGVDAGVLLDRCKEHGAWLDGGELGRLLRWARAGGMEKGVFHPFRE